MGKLLLGLILTSCGGDPFGQASTLQRSDHDSGRITGLDARTNQGGDTSAAIEGGDSGNKEPSDARADQATRQIDGSSEDGPGTNDGGTIEPNEGGGIEECRTETCPASSVGEPACCQNPTTCGIMYHNAAVTRCIPWR